MKRYTTYEETERTLTGEKDTRTKKEWETYYIEYVDHAEYPDFEGWLADMVRSGNLIEETEDTEERNL